MKNRILAELEREWAELEASLAAAHGLTRWTETEPALVGCVTGGDFWPSAGGPGHGASPARRAVSARGRRL